MNTLQLDALDALDALLGEVRLDPSAVARLCSTGRQSTALLAALPPRFEEVLMGLLDRLESSALFSEESCSFSQKDLLDNLQVWSEKARARIATA